MHRAGALPPAAGRALGAAHGELGKHGKDGRLDWLR